MAPGVSGGAGYSSAVRLDNLIFISGQIGLDENGGIVAGGIVPETEACISALERVLETQGLNLNNVAKVLVFLTDLDDYAAYNETYKRCFPTDALPARSTVGVSSLVLGARIEIEAIALSQAQ
jgi:2-iminobutanoate/2-iminopropanoate deaminase